MVKNAYAKLRNRYLFSIDMLENSIFYGWKTCKNHTKGLLQSPSYCFRLHMDGCWFDANPAWSRLAEQH